MKTNTLIFWLGILLLTGGGGYAVYNMTRGLRNNNPGNIHRDDQNGKGTAWEGLRQTQTDTDYWQFTTPEYGIRALAKTLQTYMNTYGLKTVSDIISRWAPSSENDTTSYIQDVAMNMDVDENTNLSTADLPGLVTAIIRHENGLQPYSDATINTGIALTAS